MDSFGYVIVLTTAVVAVTDADDESAAVVDDVWSGEDELLEI